MNAGDTNRFSQQAPQIIGEEALFDLSLADIALFLTPQGDVTRVTGRAGRTPPGAEDWTGRKLVDLVDLTLRVPVERAMRAAEKGSANSTRLQVSMRLGTGARLVLLVSFMPFDGGLVMLGLDQGLLSDAVERADRLQGALEALEDENRLSESQHRILLTHIHEALVLVDVNTGRILDLTGPAVDRLGLATEGQASSAGVAFTQCFEGRRRSEFIDGLCAAAMSKRSIAADLRAKDARVLVTPDMTRINGTPVLICRLTNPSDSPSTGLADFTTLADRTSDAMICIDTRGVITRTNPAFVNLVDAPMDKSVLGRSIVGFLARGAIDLKVLSDTDRPRIFSTKVIRQTGSHVPVEIAVADLGDGDLGLTIRDASLLAPGRAPQGPQQTDSPDTTAQSVAAAQVGTLTLRDIVSGMTDVVERECIEAAIAMTQNNRVAAAEMLGLSRQSLYVKLRKFGMLDKSDE